MVAFDTCKLDVWLEFPAPISMLILCVVDDDIRGRPAVDGLVHPLIIEYTVLGHFYYEGRLKFLNEKVERFLQSGSFLLVGFKVYTIQTEPAIAIRRML